MKILTLLTAAALSCCTFSTTLAQVQILRAAGPSPAPRLVSDQTQREDLTSAVGAPQRALSGEGTEQIANPFDYFAEQESPQTTQAAPTEAATRSLPEQPGLIEDAASDPVAAQPPASDSLPATLPVGRHHHQRSIVDTIVDQAALGNVPQLMYAPLYAAGAPQTPNPVADWLLREECVAGLWGGYDRQRAAECAHMWAHLSSHCGHHATCGHHAGACNACNSPRVRNRYLEAPIADVGNCAACNGF